MGISMSLWPARASKPVAPHPHSLTAACCRATISSTTTCARRALASMAARAMRKLAINSNKRQNVVLVSRLGIAWGRIRVKAGALSQRMASFGQKHVSPSAAKPSTTYHTFGMDSRLSQQNIKNKPQKQNLRAPSF